MQFLFFDNNKTTHEALSQAWATLQQGGLDAGEKVCRKLLRKFPASADTLHMLGIIALQTDRIHEARTLVERALRILPANAQAYATLAMIESELGQHPLARKHIEQAIAFTRDDAFLSQLQFQLGNTLDDLGDKSAAIAAFDAALSHRPDFSEAYRNRGIVLLESDRRQEAIADFDRALALDAADFSAHFNRGKAHLALREPAAALQDIDHAITLRPQSADAHNLRGIVLQRLGRYRDALSSFELAIILQPDFAGAHWNAALCRLGLGDWSRESWLEYEWGWQIGQRQPVRRFAQPLWLGETPIAGKRILIHDEQGLGDTIQFARFATTLVERGAHVIMQVQPVLKRLMATLAGPHELIAEGEALPPFDHHCPLLSLPLALGISLDTLPSSDSYLLAQQADVDRWQHVLGPRKGLRIGIAWSGNPGHPDDHNRSIALQEMLALYSENIQLVTLQKDLRDGDAALLEAHPDIVRAGEDVSDFADTAALVMQMDLVVSVSTSVAHLAAALGKETWILLSASPCWRWLHGREDSPWHPSARLFRQERDGDWDGTIARVRAELSLR